MGYIKNLVVIFCVYTGYVYSSDYYLLRFHRGLPLHYRAEMCLLDNRYARLLKNIQTVKDEEFKEIFESMEYVVARLFEYKIAQYDYQSDINKYKNKLSEFKKEKGTLK